MVQAEGSFPVEHRTALGGRIYGCDDCQEVCPPSRRGPEGATAVAATGAWVDLLDLLDATDEELLARHGRWYVPRRDPRYLRRNALVALGNVADPSDPVVLDRLTALADGDDDLLAEHASWALVRLAERLTDRAADPATEAIWCAEPASEGRRSAPDREGRGGRSEGGAR
jgi:epoxyqueuosine reductase